MVRLGIVAACAMAAGLLAACGATDEGSPISTASETPAGCVDPGPIAGVGSAALDAEPTYVTLTAGTYAARAEGFLHGGFFDPPVWRTSVIWGPATSAPTYNPGPGTVTNATESFDVVEGSVTLLTMPAGRIWLVNSNAADLSLQACGGAQISAVSTSP
jgi:hypothetical protein